MVTVVLITQLLAQVAIDLFKNISVISILCGSNTINACRCIPWLYSVCALTKCNHCSNSLMKSNLHNYALLYCMSNICLIRIRALTNFKRAGQYFDVRIACTQMVLLHDDAMLLLRSNQA